MIDFYSTAAQIIVVLLLALVWESKYFEEFETLTPVEHAARHFWTKCRVRVYSLSIITFVITALGVAITVLAGFLDDDALVWRIWVFAAIVVALLALLSRMWIDILKRTG
ncbi:hypothetical protein EEB14_20855 [Rhodococcus sp. WS4]|nr:hypothetical protein EEB14_20855 [Rhodococcus sp. WS4]